MKGSSYLGDCGSMFENPLLLAFAHFYLYVSDERHSDPLLELIEWRVQVQNLHDLKQNKGVINKLSQ